MNGASMWARDSRRSTGRAVAEFIVVAICVPAFAAILLNVCLLLLTGKGGESRDFISYWAAAHQLAAHSNPYDPDSIRSLQLAAGMNTRYAAGMMRNPPSALALVLPLSLLGVRGGSVLWSISQVGAIVLSTFLLWHMSGRPRRLLRLFGYTFGPALACVLVGQSSVFVMLGLVLFLFWHKRMPFLAGMSLWLCMLKPHLLLPFAVVLLLWIVATRSYGIIAGAATAFGLSTTAALLFDPAAWAHYRQMMTSTGIESEFIPCLSVLLRLGLHSSNAMLQFLPAALGVAWAMWYFHTRLRPWDWLNDLPPLLFVSLLVAPYAWFTDQAILLPAILVTAFAARSRVVLMALALGSAAVQIEVIMGLPFHSALHLAGAPAWLAWCVWARANKPADAGVKSSTLLQEPA